MQAESKQKAVKSLNALLVQNNPKLLQKKKNIEECRKLLADKKTWTNFDSKDKLEEIDLIAFPEMAFTGYNFENDKHVLPLACFVNQGQDFDFARQVCKQYKAYVIFGYVEKVLKSKQGELQVYDLYNAAAVLDREGNLILNTRKTHLYFCDQLWSKQGDGFKTVQIINKKCEKIKCAVGICMDINQKNFTSGKCQLADYIKAQNCECLIFISNWTDNSPTTNQHQQLIRMLNYWLYRLEPLLKKNQPQRLFLICDRVGSEYNYYDKKETWFFGCSGGLDLKQKPQIYDVIDKRKEGCIYIKGKIPENSHS